MGSHLLQSLILTAIVKCAVFSGDLSRIGEGHMDKIFYEAGKIILDLVEKDSIIIHFETDTMNAEVLDFHTDLKFRILCYTNVFKKGNDLHFPKFRNDIQRTKGNFFASVAGTVTVGIFHQLDCEVSMWFLHCSRLCVMWACGERQKRCYQCHNF